MHTKQLIFISPSPTLKSLKHAATPFVPDGSVSVEDEEAKGELAPMHAAFL